MEIRSSDTWLKVTSAPINTSEVDAYLRHEDAGGICIFVGTTRRRTGAVETVELRYDAFDEMALSEMARLGDEARARWPLKRVALHHRTGTVRPGEASVIAAVSAPHRAEAFEACRYLIDTLKERVPVWKKEVNPDGSSEWVEPEIP